ncbi:GntR family transcriptional regulator [Tessaracoccus lubricantis]|uniref:GntR family transcriptional regulator n=1 Tax=Tessaracoccus lubricantis TaxID=545543 RepID=A0ABP9F2R3_9ACTN
MYSLRSVSLGDRLADFLRLDIVQGRIAPGTHLVEDALAEKFGVSRGPVRDALRLLTGEGLLESRRRGIYVKSFTAADIDELYAIREAAEQLSCRLAISTSEAADWETAQELVEEMRQAALADDRPRYAKADLAFHTEYYLNSGSPRLLSLWEQYRPIFATLLEVTNSQDSDLGPSASDHTELMDLTIKGDAKSFAAELTRHLAGSRRRMHEALRIRDEESAER